jgi:molybdate transport system regulatory protein
MNVVRGRILAVQGNGHLSLVDIAVDDEVFTAILLETPAERPALTAGAPAVLQFKETEVALAKGLSGLISLRNRFPVTVTEILRGELLSEVVLDYRGRALSSIVTTRAVERLQLVAGDHIEALVKANEMMVRALRHEP